MKYLFFLVSLLACTLTAQGITLLNENFNSLSIGDLNGQDGWSAVTEMDVAAGGLDYSNGDISIDGGTNHAVWTNASAQGAASKAFTGQTGDVWFSFTYNTVSAGGNSRYWFQVGESSGLANSGVMGRIQSNSGLIYSGYRVNTSQFISGGSALPAGNVFLVGRLSKDGTAGAGTGYDLMEMWINPSSTTLGVANIAENAANFDVTIDTFGISVLNDSSTVQWDNLLVGTTQADVLDIYAIPEPSTYAMAAGLLGMAVVCLRQRRS
ncbi:PEP-CTERM sorting domain-containing protein [Rubellicoccus peritrichatus]|uniref:Ice-binding protein C-terminal domain-containing protein n=1 Tax=Rubellicoccus peritrichatus TaxID=3080537 RepID=A0AAQ3L7I9_9BACT|nr:PEP-CTERM sorting domain-containing protein [Puniceicoccus sp. CR14]WOO40092.1 hypothetical protein RZN69_15835 [Puniceicoccus sp. CR14]